MVCHAVVCSLTLHILLSIKLSIIAVLEKSSFCKTYIALNAKILCNTVLSSVTLCLPMADIRQEVYL